MIPRSAPTLHADDWQSHLKSAVTSFTELCERLQLDPASATAEVAAANHQFSLKVPEPYLSKIELGNWQDPLLLQVLPQGIEMVDHPGYSNDPLEEADTNAIPGLIHKYQGRVLLVVTGNCAINCRYCFRRHFPYAENRPNRQQWQQALDYIAQNTSITEVIYSGGDPLAASDRQLTWLTEAIAEIPHVTRLRIHSRLPVVIPQRIDTQCLQWLDNDRFDTTMVLHINHANEIDADLQAAVQHLKQAGITVLNQSVLLAGVNDNVLTLKHLSERLFASGILPYYIHLLDPVAGSAHFKVAEHQAVRLITQLMECLPGYLVPKLVKELPKQPSKTPIPITTIEITG